MLAAAPRPLDTPGQDSRAVRPAHLADWRGRHAGETVLVCGCGASLSTLHDPERFVTIGVNDVGRLFQPDYLVVVNPRNQFHGDRFRYVDESRARAIFTQLDLGLSHPHVVRFQLGKRCGVDFSNPNVLHYTTNSPYVALCLAVHMGARRIGVIGVDFTDGHFFAQTGRHSLEPQLPQMDAEYKRLNDACLRLGIEIFNVSAVSRLTAFPKLSLDEFASLAGKAQPQRATAPLSIVSYATTPVAGVPPILSRSIAASTSHGCRTVWATRSYGNGVAFDGDVEWNTAPKEAEGLLESASLVIVHNGKVDPRHRSVLSGKPVITMAHNYLWNVDSTFVSQGFPGVVVGQYQAILPEFRDWQPVPNPVPLWEPAFQTEPKPAQITICYTPSGKHEVYPPSHRLYWHSKGYASTMRVLERLDRECGVRLEVVRDGQVSHADSLAMKRRSHIVIDECVTGSYHRNSLEGMAAGSVVVNGVGLLPAVEDVFRRCSGASQIPFVFAGLGDLESVLRALLGKGPEALAAAGAENRRWMERHWNFHWQWEQFWEPVIARALERAHRTHSVSLPAPVEVSSSREQSMGRETVLKELKTGLSAVVCHGGKERLAHLSASLANLRQCEGMNEIVVVDMGDSPWAEEAAHRWADKYVFIHNTDVFERARSLNTGTALSSYDLVLWKDNDLLVPPGFIASAVAEMRTRQLDFLIPYTGIKYLCAPDSRDVMQGVRNPVDCTPVKIFRAVRQNCGAAGMVRRSFVLNVGGLSEEFRGWGGEDDAWWHKAQILGRAAISQRQDQFLYHLYHENSGANNTGTQIAANPYYPQNLALLKGMRTLRTRDLFLRRYPPPEVLSRVWASRRVLLLTESPPAPADWPADQVCAHLNQLFGITTEHWKIEPEDPAWLSAVIAHSPDGVVIASANLALRLLSDENTSALWSKTFVVLPEVPPPPDSAETLDRAAAILPARTPAGLDAALALLQPLSILLGGAMPRKATKIVKTDAPKIAQDSTSRAATPVWLYWEGECPAWIQQCRQTVFAHAADVRLLSESDFDKLRDTDRDIDLQRLQVAHRADYIRAYLLKHYGGIWVDSDCVLMQSLQPILALLKEYDFVAHRERSGYVSNGFIASRPDGVIVSELYQRICALLRSRRPLGWISLGGEPLTEILKSPGAPWHEIECERIQPICWSNPAAFFARNDTAAHVATFDQRAICYMLSNTEIRKFQAANPSADIMAEDSFFSFLIRRSLQEAKPRTSAGSSLSAWQQIPFGLEAISGLRPKRVLDIGTGLGRWGVLIREFCEERAGQGSSNGNMQIERIEALAETSPSVPNRPFYDRLQTVNGSFDIAALMDGNWDLTLISDVLDHWPRETGRSLLNRALDTAGYVLVNQAIESTSFPPNESAASSWVVQECLDTDPIRYSVFGDRKDYASFLLSRSDPQGLRAITPVEEIFSRHIESYIRVGDESISGPGSSLYHTGEIRQRLPLLFQDLGIRCLLDAPCGDFNWMRHVNLALEDYTGVDIIPAVIEQNQQKYGGPNRRFLKLDLTRSPLPPADLILCRDYLPHLAYQDAFRTIRNFVRSGARYLLATTFENVRQNSDIATGGWRPLNLRLPPFHFPQPHRIINEKCKEDGGKYADKSLALWSLSDLRLPLL